MTQLTNRQRKILDFISSKDLVQNQDVVAFFASQNNAISRETVARELHILVSGNHLKKTGKGRSVAYVITATHPFLKPIDYESYLSKEVDLRAPQTIFFNHEIFPKLQGLLDKNEIASLSVKNETYKKRSSNLSPTIIKKEFERITIELAWKSSKIEGNTYSLIDTEILIKEHREATGHKKEEAVMILNHEKAFDYIFNNQEKFKTLGLREVENVHRLLVEGLNINTGVRRKAVGITGTAYRPLDNEHQITEMLERAISEINRANDPWNKALLSLVIIAYIQPFEDGNKRTSRLIANACLVAHEACPLSFRSVDETEYKKAITLFYELQNASLVKKLFLEQSDFSIKNYFLNTL